MNIQNLSKFFTLSIGTFLLVGCVQAQAQDNRFPLLGEDWKRLSDCKLVEGLEMIAQVNVVSGEAIIAYFDPKDPEGNELYREDYIKNKYDPDPNTQWYMPNDIGLINRMNDTRKEMQGYGIERERLDGIVSHEYRDEMVLFKTTNYESVEGDPRSRKYRIWFWNADSHYCTSPDDWAEDLDG